MAPLDFDEIGLLIKTGFIAKRYYSQPVPFPLPRDKQAWLRSLPQHIANDFKDASLDYLMRHIPFLAWYMPRFVGSLDEYYRENMTCQEYLAYQKLAGFPGK